MEEQFLDEILRDTYTLGSFKKRVMALKLEVEKKIFHSFVSKEAKDESNLSEAQIWAREFDKETSGQITSDNFKEVFERLDRFISNPTPLSIYFVFIPDEGQLKEVGEWLRKSLKNPKLIFDVKVDPGLIGGLAIAYKGVYKDFSLKAKISGNKEKLVGEFRRYFNQ